jgi:formylglycine-generating enzyme required for sulfatase activity
MLKKIIPFVSRSVIATIGLATASLFSQQAAPPEIAELQVKYDERVSLDVLRPHELAVADLNAKFAAALDRAQETVQKKGKLEDALAIKLEKEAVLTSKYEPPQDEAMTPATLKTLRATYRASLGKLELERDKKLRPLKESFASLLEAQVLIMTKRGRLDVAMMVKKMRENLLINIPASQMLPASDGEKDLLKATPESPYINSLGMKFVPVSCSGKTFLISMWSTRFDDYAAFVKDTKSDDEKWKKEISSGVVQWISWTNAVSFCEWLTKQEIKSNQIKRSQDYRLPTSDEWACAEKLFDRDYKSAWDWCANSTGQDIIETRIIRGADGRRTSAPRSDGYVDVGFRIVLDPN